jgi:RNA polymerase sigma-70 factor, ECF subfamily
MCLDAAWTRCGDELRALVVRAVERDPDAWEQLYRRCYRNLYAFARRRLLDGHAADDVVSETMTRALDNIDRFSWRGGGFDAWLYGIARNVVFELCRHGARTVGSIDDERATTDRGPEEQAVANDDVAAVRWAFDRLGPDDRELLELRVQGGLSSEEVGQLLGKQPGAVRMAQARALGRLRTILEETRDVR